MLVSKIDKIEDGRVYIKNNNQQTTDAKKKETGKWVTVKSKSGEGKGRKILLGKGGVIKGGNTPKSVQGTKIGSKEMEQKLKKEAKKKNIQYFRGEGPKPKSVEIKLKKEKKKAVIKPKKKKENNKKKVKPITNGFKVIQEGLSSEQLAKEILEIKDWKKSRKDFGRYILEELEVGIMDEEDTTGFIYKENGNTKGISLATVGNSFPKGFRFNDFDEVLYLVTKEKGYGTKMILKMVKDILKRNKNGVVIQSSSTAKKFYEKIGMQRVEEYSDLYMFDKKGMKEFINKFDKKEK